MRWSGGAGHELPDPERPPPPGCALAPQVAIKRVSRVFQDLIDAKRILREIKLLRHLGRHDNIIEILDIMTGPPETEDFHTLYIVTQLFECDLERIVSSSQRLTDQHAQYFVYQILRGLRFIHSAHVLHRDLKPSNLLVNRCGAPRVRRYETPRLPSSSPSVRAARHGDRSPLRISRHANAATATSRSATLALRAASRRMRRRSSRSAWWR
jgi:serine/threonine protein kinase